MAAHSCVVKEGWYCNGNIIATKVHESPFPRKGYLLNIATSQLLYSGGYKAGKCSRAGTLPAIVNGGLIGYPGALLTKYSGSLGDI